MRTTGLFWLFCLRVVWVLAALCLSLRSEADALTAVDVLRIGGCGGSLPAAPAVHRSAPLDRVAQQWAAGRPLAAATEAIGYQAQATTAVHVTGSDFSLIDSLRRSGCRPLADRRLTDIGIYRRGQDNWIVLASAYITPAPTEAPRLATRVLDLVNAARARGTRCGDRSYAAAPPVTLSGSLAQVALGHASDMATHGYFEHEDLAGHSPADRVRAVGYKEKLVGENIAYGPQTADEVVQGWLASPGHCENIMDPRFAEMGIGYAPGQAQKHGLYWVQLLAAPKT
jgi:uncharacterized protein YkwD